MSPTVQTLVYGFIALVAMAIIGRLIGGAAGLGSALKLFFPVWLAYCLWHMYVGVSQHGYSIAEEIPFLLLNFAVPAAAAWFALRKWA
jgi:hypothetical protein